MFNIKTQSLKLLSYVVIDVQNDVITWPAHMDSLDTKNPVYNFSHRSRNKNNQLFFLSIERANKIIIVVLLLWL